MTPHRCSVQASALSWTQPGGEETYAPTRELIATPPVFTLPPDGEQIVRVALRREPDSSAELAYRLLLAEVPPAPTADFTGLRVALRLSLPVFVQPTAAAKPDLEWNATWVGDGELQISAANRGTAHSAGHRFRVATPGQRQIPECCGDTICPSRKYRHVERKGFWTGSTDRRSRRSRLQRRRRIPV